jgi:hypothetical protein
MALAAEGAGTTAYIDAVAAASGAAFGALHFRGGAVIPLADLGASATFGELALESEAYISKPADVALAQIDALGVFRIRRSAGEPLYAGAGAGFGFSRAVFEEAAGGSEAYSDTKIKAVALAEAGCTLVFAGTPLCLEPFIRANCAAGRDSRSGTSLAADARADSWSLAFSGEVGLRLGFKFR